MATLLQKRAIEILVENKGKSVSRAMREAGYSPRTAKNPAALTDRPIFKEFLAQNGLTDKLVARSLVEDIKKKPQNRIAELNLGAKILGMIKTDDEGGQKNYVQNNIVITEGTERFVGKLPQIITTGANNSSETSM